MNDSPSISSGFDLSQRSAYPYATTEHLRFADVDANGHINNVAFLVFFENVRVNYVNDRLAGLQRHGLGVILAHLDIDYHRQLFHPGTIEATARLIEIRRSSVVIAQAVFDSQGRCAASGQAILVAFDRAADCAVPIPSDVRREFERLLAHPEGPQS
jgi:acyl-CoA thioester hydrolase